MIARNEHAREIRKRLRSYPVVAILGARQTGKTTLARSIMSAHPGRALRFDLESPEDLTRLDDPMRALAPLRGLIVLDEVQRLPEVFSTLRVLVDRPRTPARFLVLGSASVDLLRQASQSLAGRISHYELPGFSLAEVGAAKLSRLWIRGGFPRSYLAASGPRSVEWRADFVRTFLERDLPQLGIRITSPMLRRFWTMLAHFHGQIWNASMFARSLGTDHKTARHYLDVLTATFVVRQLQPWHENLGKRQVKSPKIYLTDSGLLHTLLGLRTEHDVQGHPKVGASWEGFLLHEVVRRLRARPEEIWFWATHAGAELDLLVRRGTRRLGFEFKRSVAPKVTRSIHVAIEDLKLTSVTIVHAGQESFPLGKRIHAVAAHRLLDDVTPLR